jgi:hypothetical protein
MSRNFCGGDNELSNFHHWKLIKKFKHFFYNLEQLHSAIHTWVSSTSYTLPNVCVKIKLHLTMPWFITHQ